MARSVAKKKATSASWRLLFMELRMADVDVFPHPSNDASSFRYPNKGICDRLATDLFNVANYSGASYLVA
ncbi:hypothetical protein KGP93_23155 [Burkholderia multivorans]|nr:hypothetical protein [Burkholderia multivorans]